MPVISLMESSTHSSKGKREISLKYPLSVKPSLIAAGKSVRAQLERVFRKMVPSSLLRVFLVILRVSQISGYSFCCTKSEIILASWRVIFVPLKLKYSLFMADGFDVAINIKQVLPNFQMRKLVVQIILFVGNWVCF